MGMSGRHLLVGERLQVGPESGLDVGRRLAELNVLKRANEVARELLDGKAVGTLCNARHGTAPTQPNRQPFTGSRSQGAVHRQLFTGRKVAPAGPSRALRP